MISSSGHVMASDDQTRSTAGLLRRSDGWGGNLQLGKHASRVEVALMPRQRLVKQVWGMAGVRASREGTGEVIPQWIPVGRVRAALDDPWGPVPGSQPAQVGEALLSHDDVYVVLGMVDVADIGTIAEIAPSLAVEGDRKKLQNPLRAKSPLPPMPFMIALPMTWVEFTLP